MNRRSLFRAIAGLAALPIIDKLPAQATTPIKRVGAWATMHAGEITAVTIISAGSGYSSSPLRTLPPKQE